MSIYNTILPSLLSYTFLSLLFLSSFPCVLPFLVLFIQKELFYPSSSIRPVSSTSVLLSFNFPFSRNSSAPIDLTA